MIEKFLFLLFISVAIGAYWLIHTKLTKPPTCKTPMKYKKDVMKI